MIHSTQILRFFILVMVLSFGSSLSAQETSYPVASIPCPEVVTQTVLEVEGQTLECGTVTVPANYDEPDGVQIDLMYGILRSTSLSPAPDPIIYLHGGPGGGELAAITNALAERLSTLRERRDIIVFDQRGASFSPGEIECNDIFAANRDAAFEAAPQIAEETGINPGAAASEYLIPLCAEHLNERGVDLSQYNTVNNARDVASLAEALDLSIYNIYGHSYGTRLGLEVIRQNPPGLRAVLLDSVLPTDVAWRERLPETNEEAFLGIYGMCLEDPACAEAYPDLVRTLNDLFAQIDDDPITQSSGIPITGSDLEQLILFSANVAGGQWRVRYLPRMIHDLARGDTEVYEGLFFQSYAEVETAPPSAYSIPGLSFDAILLLNRANSLAQQADELDEVGLALANQALDVNTNLDDRPVSVFLRTLNQLEAEPYSTTMDDAYAADRTALPLQETSVDVLNAFINQHFVGVDAEILLALTADLTTEDVEELYRRLRNEDRFTNSLQELAFTLRLFNCNDSVPFNSADVALANIDSYQIPGLTEREGRVMAYELSNCNALPTDSVPEGFHDPVIGDGTVPIMIFTGTNDI